MEPSFVTVFCPALDRYIPKDANDVKLMIACKRINNFFVSRFFLRIGVWSEGNYLPVNVRKWQLFFRSRDLGRIEFLFY